MATKQWQTKKMLSSALARHEWDHWTPPPWKALEPRAQFSRAANQEVLRVAHTSYFGEGRFCCDWVVEHVIAESRRIWLVKVGTTSCMTNSDPVHFPTTLVLAENGKLDHTFATWLVSCFIAATDSPDNALTCKVTFSDPARDYKRMPIPYKHVIHFRAGPKNNR